MVFGRGKVKRKAAQEVVQHVAQEVAGAPPMEVAVVQRMMGEFLASTALARVQADVGAIARQLAEWNQNVANLNSALGEFRENAILQVKRELEYLRYNLGARTEDNVGSMSKLVHHLEAQIELLLKARGVNPKAVDSNGETVLDKMGIAPDRLSLVDLEREGVQLVETGNASADQVVMLQASNDKMREKLIATEQELNLERARLAAVGVVARGGSIGGVRPECLSDSLEAVAKLWAEYAELKRLAVEDGLEGA